MAAHFPTKTRFYVLFTLIFTTVLLLPFQIIKADSLSKTAAKNRSTIGILLTQRNKATIQRNADGLMFGISRRFSQADQEILNQQNLMSKYPHLGAIVTEGLAYDASLLILSPDFDSPQNGN